MPSPQGRAVCGRVCTEKSWGVPSEPLGSHTLPALDAKTPWEMLMGLGMLLKGEDTGRWEVSKRSIPYRTPPSPTRNVPDYFFFSPQAAAPAARRVVPSVRRAACARGRPPPSAAAANRDPWLHICGCCTSEGLKKNNLIVYVGVFFICVHVSLVFATLDM